MSFFFSFLLFCLTTITITLSQYHGRSFSDPRIVLKTGQKFGTIIYDNPMRISFTMNCQSFPGSRGGWQELLVIGDTTGGAGQILLPLIYLDKNQRIWPGMTDSQSTFRGPIINYHFERYRDYKMEFYFDLKRTEMKINGITIVNQPLPSTVNRDRFIGKAYNLWFTENAPNYPAANCILKYVKINAGALTTPKPIPKPIKPTLPSLPTTPGLKQCISNCYYYYYYHHHGQHYGPNHEQSLAVINKLDKLDSINSQLFFYKYLSIFYISFSVFFIAIYWFIKKRKEKEITFNYNPL